MRTAEDIAKELKKSNGLISVSELTERFCDVDEYYNNEPWNLKQILAQIDLFVPVEYSDIFKQGVKYGLLKLFDGIIDSPDLRRGNSDYEINLMNIKKIYDEELKKVLDRDFVV